MKSQTITALLFIITHGVIAQGNIIYESKELKIEQLSNRTYRHITYLTTNDYGKVSCNGMFVIDSGEALVFDTPTNDVVSSELIKWIENINKSKVIGVVVTHFHNDCLGGLGVFHSSNIPSYAQHKTISFALKDNQRIPQIGFRKKLKLKVGKLIVNNRFFGEGHTSDNIVSYVPDEKVLFGGCLIKAEGAGKGYLGDANLSEWSTTVEKISKHYPEVNVVIPGHGNSGDSKILDYTIQLFKN